MSTLVPVILSVAALGLLVATLCALFGRLWWGFELLCHFRAHYAATAALLAGSAAIIDAPHVAAVSVLVVTANLPVLRFFAARPMGSSGASKSTPGGLIRVTSVNLYRYNRDQGKLLDFIQRQDPDILVVQEAEYPWLESLASLAGRYAHVAPEDSWEENALVLFSRYNILRTMLIPCPGGPQSLFLVELQRGNGERISVLPVHLESPRSARDAARRDRQLEALEARARATDGPLIVAGDFNATPWSPRLRQAASAAGLVNSAGGRGWLPTWPSALAALGIPIDHILFNRQLTLLEFSRSPELGSDHRAISAVFCLA